MSVYKEHERPSSSMSQSESNFQLSLSHINQFVSLSSFRVILLVNLLCSITFSPEPTRSPVTEQSPVDITARLMDQPAMLTPSKIHKRQWNIIAILRDVIRQNKRAKPLKEAPGVR